jgi:hypothetical protein
MTDHHDNPTFADVLRLRDAVARAPLDMPDDVFDRLADAKADAIEQLFDHGSADDKLRVIALLAAEGHCVQAQAARVLAAV